ncbi:TlpA family protein disulfide reductase [Flavobacterium crassostreae]|uniref:Alkyl hydroperoxide reductase n=1 Tax=Flavobacterium crassostreae TaxID=1763534 RepID=A0A1B9EA72_9FLAO|nr:TlpA disulfide reductase family protein [Flavobacterium crassostreae]OCB78788.1 alkyl hydroperoxide reductase [Flavobacterium crassostreae]
MKKRLTLLLALLTLSCIKPNTEKTSFSQEALSETLLNPQGEQVAFQDILKQHQGKTVLIEVWASWCGDCVKAMPKIKALQESNPEVEYVFISMDKTAQAWEIGLEKYALKGAHFMANDQMQGVFADAIDLDWIPRYIIVDKTGKIVLYHAVETDFDTIKTTLTSLK